MIKAIFFGFAAILFSGCVSISGADIRISSNDKIASWEFINTVGGIDISNPYLDDSLFIFAVEIDFSGNTFITNEPTRKNTGLECSSLQVIGQSDSYLDLTTKLYITAFYTEKENLPPSQTCNRIVVPSSSLLGAGSSIQIIYKENGSLFNGNNKYIIKKITI